MTRTSGVFAQPIKDPKGINQLALWYQQQVRLYILWASTANTNGTKIRQDRAAQLEWRAGVKACGPDAMYVDYPLSDWRLPVTTADLDIMATDPACLGVYLPDEPNLKPDGKIWRNPVATDLSIYLKPIAAHSGMLSKYVVVDLAGSAITASYPWNLQTDVDQLLAMITSLGFKKILILSNWHPRNNQPDRYGDDLPAKATRLLHDVCAKYGAERGSINECAFEQLSDWIPKGARAPTEAEMWAQYQLEVAEDKPDSHYVMRAWFPQAPKPNPSHVFNNTTPEQLAMCQKINMDFVGVVEQPLPPNPLQQLTTRFEQSLLDLQAAQAQIVTLQNQAQINHSRLNVLENRKYQITSVDQA